MPLVTDEMPVEGVSVNVTGTFEGTKRSYYLDTVTPVWYEAIDGTDPLIVGTVIAWEPL